MLNIHHSHKERPLIRHNPHSVRRETASCTNSNANVQPMSQNTDSQQPCPIMSCWAYKSGTSEYRKVNPCKQMTNLLSVIRALLVTLVSTQSVSSIAFASACTGNMIRPAFPEDIILASEPMESINEDQTHRPREESKTEKRNYGQAERIQQRGAKPSARSSEQ